MNRGRFEEEVKKANRRIATASSSTAANTSAAMEKLLENIERQWVQEQQRRPRRRKGTGGNPRGLEGDISKLKPAGQDLTIPAGIANPKDHLRWLIKEVALYLIFRWELAEQGKAQKDRNLWLKHRERRREEQGKALRQGVELPWVEVLHDQAISDNLRPVLDFLLAIEVSPVCLGLCRACLGGRMTEPCLVTVGEVMQLVYPYLSADEIELRGALGPQGELAQKGFLLDIERYTNHPDRSVTLKESIILAALGLRQTPMIGEDLVRREWPHVDLNRVVLPTSMKEEVLQLARNVFSAPRIGNPDSAGIALLFYGPSGTGKTLLARAIASRLNKPLLSFSAEAVNAHRHCYEDILPGLFLRAERERAIVFIDEGDDIFQEGSDASRALLLHLESARGLVIVASNNIQNLDPALERRFTVRYRFSMPDRQARRDLWQVLKPAEVQYAPEVDLPRLADKYPFSGAQIEKCLSMAAALASADNEGRRVLDEALLQRCAGEQFSIFLSEGIVKVEPSPDGNEHSSGHGRETVRRLAEEDSEWVQCYQTRREQINRFFPEHANSAPVLLVLGEAVQAGRYGKELAQRLGFRLLSARASDLVDLRQREMQKYMPFVEYNPYEFFFCRLVDNETIFLLEDDDQTLVIDPSDKWRPETFKLAAAIQKSPAVVILAGGELRPLHSRVTSLVDYVRILSDGKESNRESSLADLVNRGYPLHRGDASGWLAAANGNLRLAALDAYLRATERGEQSVSITELESCVLQMNHLRGNSAPALFGQNKSY